MFRKCLSFALVGLLLYGVDLPNISAHTGADNAVEKIKTIIAERGTGEKSKVVKIKDGKRLKNYTSQTLELSFDRHAAAVTAVVTDVALKGPSGSFCVHCCGPF